MKPEEEFRAAAPHLASVKFRHVKGSLYRAVLPDRPRGRPATEFPSARILVNFAGKDYPFERHYASARHVGKGKPHTYANLKFSRIPPVRKLQKGQSRHASAGKKPAPLLVGPWPGWKGLAAFPAITLSSAGETLPVTLMPWGDDLTTRVIRGSAVFQSPPSGEIDCVSPDRRLRPVDGEIYACPSLKVVPSRVSLRPALLGRHPRLLLTPEDRLSLAGKIQGSHRTQWERILSLLQNWGLPWEITPESKTPCGPEALGGADRALIAALAAMADPSPHRRALARSALQDYIQETQQPGFGSLTIDTQAGETLFVLSTAFDWTYDEWSAVEREEISGWLFKVADICRAHLGPDRRDFAQAHYLGCALGLLAFGFLFWEVHPRAKEWAAHCRGVLNEIVRMLPDDGSYPHGINLWIYEYGFLLRSLELFRVCAGEDLWGATPHWLNASLFRAAATSDDGLYGVTFGDPQYRVGGDGWCHYLVAARTGSTIAQWLGDLLADRPVAGVDFRAVPPRRRVYEFLFHDPGISPEKADRTLSSTRFFADGGQIFIRDAGESPSLFTFRAGPPLGFSRYLAGEQGGYGHADPANGSFLLYSGDRFVVAGPGPTYRRDTLLHNVITVGGKGQIGDSAVWLPDFLPPDALCPLPEVREFRDGVSVKADLTRSYLPHLGVTRCHRALWIVPGRCIIGVDSVRCRRPGILQWSIHSCAVPERLKGAPGLQFKLGGEGTAHGGPLLIFLEPGDAVAETGLSEMVPAYPHDGTQIGFLRLSVKGAHARFIWSIVSDPSLGSIQISEGGEHGRRGADEPLAIACEGGPNLRLVQGMLIPGGRHDH